MEDASESLLALKPVTFRAKRATDDRDSGEALRSDRRGGRHGKP